MTPYPPIPPQPPKRRPSPRRKYAITAAILTAVAAALIIGATLTQGAAPATDDTAPAATAPDPRTACIRSWNSLNQNRQEIAGLATVGQTSANPTAYVNVAYSELFPDRCLITVANSATLYAQQYMQDTGGGWTLAPDWTGQATQLGSSVTDWNAKMGRDGIIHAT
jgi:hypothetical protein